MYKVKLSSKHSALALIAVEVFILGFQLVATICLSLFAPDMDEVTEYFILLFITQIAIGVAAIGTLFASRRDTGCSPRDYTPSAVRPMDVLRLFLITCGILLFSSPLANGFSMLLEGLGVSLPASPVSFSTGTEFLLGLVFVCVMPAIFEELANRGVILNGLTRMGAWPAILLSAFIFAIMHGNPHQLIHQFFLGAVMAYAVLVSGNILSSVIIHFANNFIALLLTFLTANATVVEVTPPGTEVIFAPIVLALYGAMMFGGFCLFSSQIKRWTQSNILAHVHARPEKRESYVRWRDAGGFFGYVSKLIRWRTDENQKERLSPLMILAILLALMILALNTYTMVAL